MNLSKEIDKFTVGAFYRCVSKSKKLGLIDLKTKKFTGLETSIKDIENWLTYE